MSPLAGLFHELLRDGREAAEFFNEIALLGQRPTMASPSDELRDRALVGIAARIRKRASQSRLGDVAGELLAPSADWAPALVSDAAFAAKEAARAARKGISPPSAERHDAFTTTVLPARTAIVSACYQAAETGDVFVGFQSGELFAFRPRRVEVFNLGFEQFPVLSLAADARGEALAILTRKDVEHVRLSTYGGASAADLRFVASQLIRSEQVVLCGSIQDRCVALWDGAEFRVLSQTSLLVQNRQTLVEAEGTAVALLLPKGLASDEEEGAPQRLLVFVPGKLIALHCEMLRLPHDVGTISCQPVVPRESPLSHPQLSFLPSNTLGFELAGIADENMAFWINAENPLLEDSRCTQNLISCKGDLWAVTLIGSGMLVAVTKPSIQLYSRQGNSFKLVATKPHKLPQVVACYPHHPRNELILVCADGTIAQVWNLRH